MNADAVNSATPALCKALKQFQSECPPVVKRRLAEVYSKRTGKTFTYKYADLGDILVTIREPMARNGLSVSQPLRIGLDGKPVLKTYLFHEDGGFIESDMPLPIDGLTPQEVGSLLTYYRRYAEGAILNLASEEDDDGQMAQNAIAAPTTRKMKPEELERWENGIKQTKTRDDCAAELRLAWAKAAEYKDTEAHDALRRVGEAHAAALKAKAALPKGILTKDDFVA